MSSQYTFQYGKAFDFPTILLTAGTRNAQSNPTLAAGDVKISKDYGSFANIGSIPDDLPSPSEQLKVALTATECQAKYIMVRFKDAAGAEWDEQTVILQAADPRQNMTQVATPSGFDGRTGVTSGQITQSGEPKYGVVFTADAGTPTEDDFDPRTLLGAIVYHASSGKFWTILGGYFFDDGTDTTKKVFGIALDSRFGCSEGGSTIVDTLWSGTDLAEAGDGSGWTLIVSESGLSFPAAGDLLELWVQPSSIVEHNISNRANMQLRQLKIVNETSGQNGIDVYGKMSGISSRGDSYGMYAEAASCAAGNGEGLYAVGRGAGAGIRAQAGVTGHGFRTEGGATSGHGIFSAAQSSAVGLGIYAKGYGTNGYGIQAEGHHGLYCVGTDGAIGDGIRAVAQTAGRGCYLEGTAQGLLANATSGSGSGIYGQGGGNGIKAISTTGGAGFWAQGSGGNPGIYALGESVGAGILSQGGATGDGFKCQGGASGGVGLHARAQTNNDEGILAEGAGSGAGAAMQGGATGTGLHAKGGASSGSGLLAEAQVGVGLYAYSANSGSGIRAESVTNEGALITSAASVGLNCIAGGSNAGISASGAGAGPGVYAEGGSSGHGVHAKGGASVGDGVRSEANSGGTGMGIRAIAYGTDQAGIWVQGHHGMVSLANGTNGDGIRSIGSAGGDGIYAQGEDAGCGINAEAGGTGTGILATGGATSGDGMKLVGGPSSRDLYAAEVGAIFDIDGVSGAGILEVLKKFADDADGADYDATTDSLATIGASATSALTKADFVDLNFERDVTDRWTNQKPKTYTAGTGGNQVTVNTTQDGSGNTETEAVAP